MTGQGLLFDPGPAAEPTRQAPPEFGPEHWEAMYREQRLRRREGIPGQDTDPACERRARRRFAKRHGLGREWVAGGHA